MQNPYKHPEYLSYIQSTKDRNCCTVVALWVVTGNPIQMCAEYMRIHGRVRRKGMVKAEWNKALESMKKFKVKKGVYDQQNRITVGQFIKKHPVGTYYVANNGHAFVIRDGEVIDHTEGYRRQITCAYRVYWKEGL